MVDLASAAERSSEVESRPNKKREHKSLGAPMRSSGGGYLHASSCEGALLDLDDCLQRSLDASRQTPLPIKHSAASSFTPAAAVRQQQGANMFLMSSGCVDTAAMSERQRPAAPSQPDTHARLCSGENVFTLVSGIHVSVKADPSKRLRRPDKSKSSAAPGAAGMKVGMWSEQTVAACFSVNGFTFLRRCISGCRRSTPAPWVQSSR